MNTPMLSPVYFILGGVNPQEVSKNFGINRKIFEFQSKRSQFKLTDSEAIKCPFPNHKQEMFQNRVKCVFLANVIRKGIGLM